MACYGLPLYNVSVGSGGGGNMSSWGGGSAITLPNTTVADLATTYVQNNGTVEISGLVSYPDLNGQYYVPFIGLSWPVGPIQPIVDPSPAPIAIDYERLAMQQELAELKKKLYEKEQHEQSVPAPKEDKKRIVRLED